MGDGLERQNKSTGSRRVLVPRAPEVVEEGRARPGQLMAVISEDAPCLGQDQGEVRPGAMEGARGDQGLWEEEVG